MDEFMIDTEKLKKEMLDFQVQFEKLREPKGRYESAVTRIKTEKDDLQEQLNKHKQQLDEIDANIKTLNNPVLINQALKNTKDERNRIETAIENFKRSIANRDKELSDIKAMFKDTIDSEANLTGKFQKFLSKNLEEIGAKKAKIGEESPSIDGLKAEKAQLEAQRAEIINEDDKDAKSKRLNNRIQKLESKISLDGKEKEKLNKLKAQKNQQEVARTKELSVRMQDLDSKIESLDKKINDLDPETLAKKWDHLDYFEQSLKEMQNEDGKKTLTLNDYIKGIEKLKNERFWFKHQRREEVKKVKEKNAENKRQEELENRRAELKNEWKSKKEAAKNTEKKEEKKKVGFFKKIGLAALAVFTSLGIIIGTILHGKQDQLLPASMKDKPTQETEDQETAQSIAKMEERIRKAQQLEGKRTDGHELHQQIKEEAEKAKEEEKAQEAKSFKDIIKTSAKQQKILGSTFTLPANIHLYSTVYGEGPVGNTSNINGGKSVTNAVLTGVDAIDRKTGQRFTLDENEMSYDEWVKKHASTCDFYYTTSTPDKNGELIVAGRIKVSGDVAHMVVNSNKGQESKEAEREDDGR